MTSLAVGLFVHPSVPAKNLAEFIALLKSKPGALSFASSGNGGATHLAGESFLLATGTKMVHVPYRGSAPAIADVVAGQVPVSFADVPLAAPLLQDGRAAAPGRFLGDALADAARCADLRRVRPARHPELGLGRHPGAGRHAGRHRAQAQPRDRRHPARAGNVGAPRRPGIRGGRRHARAVRRSSSRPTTTASASSFARPASRSIRHLGPMGFTWPHQPVTTEAARCRPDNSRRPHPCPSSNNFAHAPPWPVRWSRPPRPRRRRSRSAPCSR